MGSYLTEKKSFCYSYLLLLPLLGYLASSTPILSCSYLTSHALASISFGNVLSLEIHLYF